MLLLFLKKMPDASLFSNCIIAAFSPITPAEPLPPIPAIPHGLLVVVDGRAPVVVQ
jgi:hypothetical protein